jgi:hypothetical protein
MPQTFDAVITLHGGVEAAMLAKNLGGHARSRGQVWDVTVPVEAEDDIEANNTFHAQIDSMGLRWIEISVRTPGR